ncbi:predicted protein [Sclerotinia sclerotiorum 1980 UF-70]|uniref:Uncharacterized protein n=1 Tax=Sclerotinia sclerotiorum (strain ATCC 18683 / 1980 / Ss-1) TaxID=665079 RepID=A7EX59_SCLS1|nr:predicted protein [Sclerotinia sclerotiorum 1980 UF-70]EDN94051.1 predicted protein [Sclerotinia sclerotiorum 1980 UF-70]
MCKEMEALRNVVLCSRMRHNIMITQLKKSFGLMVSMWDVVMSCRQTKKGLLYFGREGDLSINEER